MSPGGKNYWQTGRDYSDRKGGAPDPREAITYYLPMDDDREADKAPLSMRLIRRMFGYTTPRCMRRGGTGCSC